MKSYLAGILCVHLIAVVGCSKVEPSVAPPAQTQPILAESTPTKSTPLPVVDPVASPQLEQPAKATKAVRYNVPPLRELSRRTDITSSLDFSPNGRMIATGCEPEGEIAFWNWPEGTLNNVVAVTGSGGIGELRFSEDSQLLAYGTIARSYGVIEAPSGKHVARHDDSRYHYCDGFNWSADGRLLYAIANYGIEIEIHRLSLQTGESQVIVPKLEPNVIGFNFLRATPLMISQSSPQGERISLFPLGDSIDLSSPRLSFLVPSTETAPYNIAISDDGSRFAFREGLSRQVDVFQVADNKHVGRFSVDEDQLGRFQFIRGSNTKLLVSSGSNNGRFSSLAVREISKPDQIPRLELHAPTRVGLINLSRDGKLLALGFFDGSVRIWDVAAIENAAAK